MRFHYKGYDRSANEVDGFVEARNDSEAKERLRELKIMPRLIVAEEEGKGAFSLFASTNHSPPPLKDFVVFMRQLSTLQNAGLPIVDALGVLSEQSTHAPFSRVLTQVQKRVEEGYSLSDAIKRFPRIFDRTFVQLVSAGEVSGALDVIFERMALYYEKMRSVSQKIKSALLYPGIIFSTVIVISTVLLVFIVPIFQRMYKSQNKELPKYTQMIIDVSEFFRSNLAIMAVLGAAFVILFAYFLKNDDLKRKLDPIVMHVPVFGPLLLKSSLARFSRTLSTMIESGVPILDSLDVTARVSGNSMIEAAVLDTKASISEGNSISEPLEKSGIFPPMVCSMVAVGERTGELEKMLSKVADFYEDEVDTMVNSMSSILEPLLIIMIGIFVASVIIPLYLPLFMMGDLMGN